MDVSAYLKKYPFLERQHSTMNLKYFGRFTLAQHVTSAYTWVLDDDTMPSKKWIDVCLRTVEAYNAIVSSAGRILIPNVNADGTPGHHPIRQECIGNLDRFNHCPEDTVVDFGCNSWFFRTEWLKYFWGTWPYTFQNGEDIHLSATCNIAAGIRTVVPRQPDVDSSGSMNNDYCIDEHASWKKDGFYDQRVSIMKHFIRERGWKPLRAELLAPALMAHP